jgi:MFS family permease
MAGLVLVRLLLGAAEACYFVAGFAALADLAPPTRAGEALSLNSLALYAGLALGPVLGQLLHRVGGFDLVWIGAVTLSALAALLALRVPETRGAVDPARGPTPLLHRAALVPGAALFCGVLVMAGFLAFGVLRARSVGLEAWSLVLLLFGACVVGCRIGFARLPDRRPARVVLLGALATTAVGTVALGVAPGVPGLLAGAALCGVGTAFLTPAAFAMVFAAVPAAERGSAAATTSLFLDLGFTGGPVLLGLVAAASSLPAGFVVLAAVPAAAMALVAARTGSAARPAPADG